MLNQLLNNKQSEIAKTQLLDLLSGVDKAVQDGTLVAIEQINAAVQFALSKAATDIYAPIFEVNKATVGTTPNPDRYNWVFSQLISDIQTVFSELKYTGDIVVANFNRLVNEEKAILARTKKLYNKLQDLELFVTNAGDRALYVSDDFIDFDSIDYDLRFQEGALCFVDTEQGLVTLPQSLTTSTVVVNEVKINEISNGVIGNNQQIDAAHHANINEILDENADTWFEYERVGLKATDTQLVLSLTMTLADSYIINHIRVNPNNFGTSNWVKIASIETSLDDRTYISIKENLPVEGFVQLLEDDDFILAPATSKFAGQGFYTFTPRKAKYVRIVFEQPQGYFIETTAGKRFRYAVGIRDIDVRAIRYDAQGSVVSLPFGLTQEISKVALIAVENPVRSSEIAKIEHYISVDDGATWYPIQAISGEEPDIPKILTFNDESEGAIKTDSAATTIRHKAVLIRESGGFSSDKAAISETVAPLAELRQIPAATPFNVNIDQRPIVGSVRIINPVYGSKGWTSPKLYVGTSDGTPGQTFPLGANIREGEEKVYVDSQLWASVITFDSEYQYVINYEHGEDKLPLIKFGPDNSIPSNGSIISIELPAEFVVVEGKEPHTIVLENISDGDKNAMEVVNYNIPEDVVGERLSQTATRHHLRNGNIDDGTGITFNEAGAIFTSEETFIDGVTELTSAGDYSVDYLNGIIYSQTITPVDSLVTVNYTYTPLDVVDPDLWKFANDRTYQTIELDHGAYRSIHIDDESLAAQSAQLKITLANECVVRGSIAFSGTSLTIEVPFIDGITEFLDILEVDSEDVPTGGTSFFLVNIPLEAYPVVFSDTTVFQTETPTPTVPGDYYVDYVTGEVTTVSTLDDGTVSYYYQDTAKATDLAGAYSVDYREGIVYLYSGLGADLFVDYEYTRYAVRYRIAKELEPFMFKVNPDDKLITIIDPAVLDDYLPTTRHSGLIKVFYDYIAEVRESIEELEPFFTPVLKGYALKMLTPGLL
ncbi:MAG: hypothetical protein KAR39_11690 [Thermoplasmata archaeon]|nr:hypothetical protein [Thermoplasmata archaeon]